MPKPKKKKKKKEKKKKERKILRGFGYFGGSKGISVIFLSFNCFFIIIGFKGILINIYFIKWV